MKYIVITNHRNTYFIVDPIAEVAGTQWRLTIPEAVADIHSPVYKRTTDHTIFMYLKVSDSGEYYLTDDSYYKLHSIIDSATNPEFFI